MEIKTTILLVNKMSLSTLKSYKMKITKKILFPTDFSIVAENAFIYALSPAPARIPSRGSTI